MPSKGKYGMECSFSSFTQKIVSFSGDQRSGSFILPWCWLYVWSSTPGQSRWRIYQRQSDIFACIRWESFVMVPVFELFASSVTQEGVRINNARFEIYRRRQSWILLQKWLIIRFLFLLRNFSIAYHEWLLNTYIQNDIIKWNISGIFRIAGKTLITQEGTFA